MWDTKYCAAKASSVAAKEAAALAQVWWRKKSTKDGWRIVRVGAKPCLKKGIFFDNAWCLASILSCKDVLVVETRYKTNFCFKCLWNSRFWVRKLLLRAVQTFTRFGSSVWAADCCCQRCISCWIISWWMLISTKKVRTQREIDTVHCNLFCGLEELANVTGSSANVSCLKGGREGCAASLGGWKLPSRNTFLTNKSIYIYNIYTYI